MKMKKISSSLLSFLLLAGFCRLAQAEEITPASLQVMILDENGSLVHGAHVYIFSRNKKMFFGTRDAYGVTTFDLPAGNYRLYAARTDNVNGMIDHYSSPEASVRLSTDEPTSVILSLQKADDAPLYLSETARQKLGIDEKLAKYLN